MGRIDHYLLYDADSENQTEKMDLLSVFVGWFFLQLYHTVGIRWTAGTDLLYEKGKDTDPSLNAGVDDCHDHLQVGAGSCRTVAGAVRTGIYSQISVEYPTYLLSGNSAECILCDGNAGPGIPSGACKSDSGKRDGGVGKAAFYAAQKLTAGKAECIDGSVPRYSGFLKGA